MKLARAEQLIAELGRAESIRYVDVTGGEPMLYAAELAALARSARRAGLALRIVSNGFWAKQLEPAIGTLRALREAGVESVGLSLDWWHLEFLPSKVVANYVAAARAVGMVPLVSCVVQSPEPGEDGIPDEVRRILTLCDVVDIELIALHVWGAQRERAQAEGADALAAFERESAASMLVVGWQLLTAEGRGKKLSMVSLPLASSPVQPCPAAGRMPTFDSEGRLFPCCSPWVSRKTHAWVDSSATLPEALVALERDALTRVLRALGPKALIDAATARGIAMPERHTGICNQCGMLLDRFSLSELRAIAETVWSEHRAAPLH